MNSLFPKVLFVLALLLTLSLKILVHDTANEGLSSTFQDFVAPFLGRHQFQWNMSADGNRIYAASHDCRLLIRELIPQGYNMDVIRTEGGQLGRLSFVYKGHVTDQVPASAILNHYWTRLQQKIGLSVATAPILAVVSSEQCRLDLLPWNEIAEL